MSTMAVYGAGVSSKVDARDEVEVTLFWGGALDRNTLATHIVPVGRAVRIGEADGCDLAVPAAAISASSHELVSFQGGEVVVHPPVGSFVFVDRLPREAAPFVLAHGRACEIEMGAFAVRIAVAPAEDKLPVAVAQKLEESGLGSVGLSALAHAGFLAAFAFFMPSLGQADQEDLNRDQLLSMRHYLDAAAEREQDTPPPEPSAAQDDQSSGSNAGQRAAGAEGAMGTTKPVSTAGRWSAKGDERPENAQLAREHALQEAREFGLIGLLNAGAAGDPSAPVVPWGTVLAGADKESHMGNLWGNEIGDAFGTGLGLSGHDEGGGGKGQGIGIDGVGNYGHAGHCTAGADCTGGFGRGHGPLSGAHVAKGPTMRQNGNVTTNGRLDPEVIRRIVRLNEGRMVGCYQSGLRTNPSLSGRVAVAFAIDRDGTVSTARDAGSDLPDQGVTQCVVRSFYGLSFPAPAGGIVTVTYPLTFTPAQ